MRNSASLLLLCGVVLGVSGISRGAPAAADPAGIAFFETKVRPVLSASCFQCHSARSEKLKGKLFLDSREGALKGGESGPAIVPGSPEKSLLVKAIRGLDPDRQMPPKQKLTAQQIADLAQWVKMGAPWPAGPAGGAKPVVADKYADPAAHYEQTRREHWAYQPVKVSPPPAVKNAAWARSDIDRFILARLESKNLQPSPPADKRTLIRRITFDLTGLPPTPEETEVFVADTSPNAFEKVVDRLLASSRFGERWGRHWLDVARYAESTGMSRNFPLQYAWRYRDYVIDALNKDKPFNQFILEQVAGDLIAAKSPAERDEHLIATGFLAIGPKDLNEKNPRQYEMNNVDEQIDVTSKAFMATTAACARCHDHKFDPIPQADYYAMAGVFRSTQILAGVASRKGAANYSDPTQFVSLSPAAAERLPPEKPAVAAETPPGPGAAAARKAAKAAGQPVPKPAAAAKAAKAQANATAAEGIKAITVGVHDDARPADCNILLHGELDSPGSAVRRGVITLPGIARPAIPAGSSGRLELAQWIADPVHPLTARVEVNRIWQHLFGQGLVRTVDNFGTTGEAPTHPELLDALASQFVKNGWSVKKAIRAIVLSSAYQQSSAFSTAGAAVDPDVRLLWRMPQRRLEAEAIRDAMLAVSGDLNISRPFGSPVLRLPAADVGRAKRLDTDTLASRPHRSVYLPLLRNAVPEALELFDAADPNLEEGSRDVTTVATQALFMMNDPQVIAHAQAFSRRLLNDKTLNDAARIDKAYQIALGRPTTPAEKSRATAYITDCMSRKTTPAMDAPAAWSSFCQAMLGSAEFRYLN